MRFLIGDAPVEAYIEEACGVFGQEVIGGILKSLYLLALVSILFMFYTLRYKRPVSFANLIIALTILMSSFQRLIGPLIFLPPFYLLKQPPNIYNRSPNRSLYYSLSLILYYAHLLQKKRKCYINSISPQSHNAVSNALILRRYSFRNDLLVRSCIRIVASELISCQYNSAAFLR